MNGPERLLRDVKLQRLLAALATTGRESRIIGGAVRDALLGIEPKEIDLATAALPADVVTAAERAGLKAVPTGLEYGTITVVVEGSPFEVTTLRKDVETFGRAAEVRFGVDFEQDALRRDFTINALSLSADGRLHDYTDGLADLAQRRVRFIGDPATRIAEDYLRILRFFRFHAAIGSGPLDPPGLHAATAARANLNLLSRERLRAEILKFLIARGVAPTMREVAQAGVIQLVLGGVYPARLERFLAVEATQRIEPYALLRLAALSVLVREDATRLRERLRLSNAEHDRLIGAASLLEKLHGPKASFSAQEVLELLFLHKRQATIDALTLALADSAAPVEHSGWASAARLAATMEAPSFPIKGADLLALGVAPGRPMGLALKRLQADWIRAGFPRDPRRVMELLQAIAQKEHGGA